jgi:ring-1,2-phenylacetyl-CoA epoxidase subunit PaaE
MLNFHPLKVTAVERVAEDAACVTVEIPSALRDAYAFHAGQYVTVRRTIEGREERRTYSIVTAPGGTALKLGIRHQSRGRMSGELASKLRAGDLLDVGTPMGRFRTAVSAERRHSYVAFAAGSGITPVLSLATDILAREPHSRFTLIYGNRSISRTMFLEETLALKNRYIDRFAAHFVMSREPQQAEWLNGRIDGRKVHELARHMAEVATADEYFVCGPGGMVDELRNAIKELNGNAPIRFERFAAAAPRAAESGVEGSPTALLVEGAPPADGVLLGEGALLPESVALPRGASLPQEVLATVSVTMDGRRRPLRARCGGTGGS